MKKSTITNGSLVCLGACIVGVMAAPSIPVVVGITGIGAAIGLGACKLIEKENQKDKDK